MFTLISIFILSISLFAYFCLLHLFQKQKSKRLTHEKKAKLLLTGTIANFADTLGMGSYAITTALNKLWNLIHDKSLPGTLNSQSILPTIFQALIFLKFIDIDFLTLITLTIGASFGGLAAGFFIARLNKQHIRLCMSYGYLGIALLLLCHQLQVLPLGGDSISLEGKKLLYGFFAMIAAGMLPSIGVGIYAPIQVILFLFGMSPLIAFPIMTTVGAITQSLTAYAFIAKKEVATRESLALSWGGVLGVLLATPLVTLINLSSLRWLLMLIVCYNAWMIWKSYKKDRFQSLETARPF